MAVQNQDLDPVPGSAIDVDANVRKVVKALLTINDMTPDDLAEQLPMSRSTLYTRLATKGKQSRFTVAEVYRMAHLFGTKVGTFYEPPELATFGYKSQAAGERPVLTSIDGSGRGTHRPTRTQFFPALVPDLDSF